MFWARCLDIRLDALKKSTKLSIRIAAKPTKIWTGAFRIQIRNFKVFNTVTGLQAERPGVRIPGRGKRFHIPQNLQTGSGPQKTFPLNGYRSSFLGIKWPAHNINHLLHLSGVHSVPPIPLHAMNRGYITFNVFAERIFWKRIFMSSIIFISYHYSRRSAYLATWRYGKRRKKKVVQSLKTSTDITYIKIGQYFSKDYTCVDFLCHIQATLLTYLHQTALLWEIKKRSLPG